MSETTKKEFFWTEVVFLIKIENFYQKNNFGLIDFLLARLFGRSKKTVRKRYFYLFCVSKQIQRCFVGFLPIFLNQNRIV